MTSGRGGHSHFSIPLIINEGQRKVDRRCNFLLNLSLVSNVDEMPSE